MAVSLRALAAVLALALVALALTPNLGFYTLPGMLAVLVATAIVVGACLLPERRVRLAGGAASGLLFLAVGGVSLYLLRRALTESNPWLVQIAAIMTVAAAVALVWAWLARARPDNIISAFAIGIGCLLSGYSVLQPQLRFGEPGNLQLSFVTNVGFLVAGVLGYLVWLSFLPQPSCVGRRRGWLARWGLLLVVGGTLRVLAVVGSPDPVIDVKTWLQNAPRFLLQGENPYNSAYPSPYGTARALRFNIAQAPEAHPASYPPGVVLTGLPAALLGFDVRYVNVAADVLAAVLILLVGWRCGAADVGLLASGLYLCLPRAAFMTEQAWFEPQLAAMAGLFALWMPTRPRAAALALGGLLSLKQYVLMLAPAILGLCRGRLRVVVWGVGVALVISLPFVAWDAGAFWQMVIRAHLHRPVVYHSLILPALLHNEFGWTVPRCIIWTVVGVLLLALGRRAPEAGRGPGMLWLAASMLVFNLLVQGFPNYYYFAQFLLLLGLAQGREPASDPSPKVAS